MAESMQMLERYACPSLLVEHDVGHAFECTMASHTNCRQKRRFKETGVHSDEAFHSPLEQKLRVVAKHVEVVAMNYRKEKVIVLPEIGLNPTDDQGAIRVTNLLEDKSYSVSAFLAQRSG